MKYLQITNVRIPVFSSKTILTIIGLIMFVSLFNPKVALAIGYKGNKLPNPIKDGPVIKINPGSEGSVVNQYNDASRKIRGQKGANGRPVSGTILFKKGTYRWNHLKLSSNIHVRFEKGVKVILTGNNARLFSIGTDVKNCSIEGPVSKVNDTNMTEILMPAYNRISGDTFHLASISVDGTNCRIKNLKFLSRGAEGNVIGVAPNANKITFVNIYARPVAGVVRYTSPNNVPLMPGWSVIQLQGGKSIKIRNISGYGGYTLRLEQNASAIGTRGIVGLNAKKVINYDGRGALILVAHGGVKDSGNKNIVIQDVRSYGSGWAATFGATTHNGRIGSYDNLKISKVVATYKRSDYGYMAQFRHDERRHLPENQMRHAQLLETVSTAAKFYRGPSLGVLKDADKYDWVKVSDVKGKGFPSSYNIDAR